MIFPQEDSSAVCHPLDDAVEVLKMLPDEAADTAVLWDCLEGAVLALIHSCGVADVHVVDVGNGELGNLWLKNMSNVIVENWNSIGPTHGQLHMVEHAIQRLECHIVAR